MRARLSRGVLAGAALLAVACAGPAGQRDEAETAYRPTRIDYTRFLERLPRLVSEPLGDVVLEPNYLPFMAHRLPGRDGGADEMVFCRWAAEQMPLPVYVEAPRIPSNLQDEFDPVAPEVFTQAVVRALEVWEQQLEGLVRFRRVDRRRDAALVLRLLGEVAPSTEEGFDGLGRVQSLGQACRVTGEARGALLRSVHFEVSSLDLYIADRVGLLTPVQVERIALHEIGHALGMRQHSPLSTDLMYWVPTDSIYGAAGETAEGLSTLDLNSFISLYLLPSGSVFAEVGEHAEAETAGPGPGEEVVFALAPAVDARRGFEVRVPAGWVRVPNPHGLFVANGPIWDYDASFEIFIWPHPSVERYLERYADGLFAGSWLRRRSAMVVAGRPALLIEVEEGRGRMNQEFIFVELGDGRVMVILAEAPLAHAEDWRPWFRAILGSLEIWD
ncbi:MAG: matrixin family metalloprotease [Deltaproteobacteria bacterium]|nr:matrixin family metalloprotease [Deltaproteobacteria bacterium]